MLRPDPSAVLRKFAQKRIQDAPDSGWILEKSPVISINFTFASLACKMLILFPLRLFTPYNPDIPSLQAGDEGNFKSKMKESPVL